MRLLGCILRKREGKKYTFWNFYYHTKISAIYA